MTGLDRVPRHAAVPPTPFNAATRGTADRPNAHVPIEAAGAVPTPSSGVSLRTSPSATVEAVRRQGFEAMADQAGLTGPRREEFFRRAERLDAGGLNMPAAARHGEARPMTSDQARTAIGQGCVVLAPTRAQAGLLQLLQARQADEAGPQLPSGAAAAWALPRPANTFDGVPGKAGVKPEVAKSILDNVKQGRPPFDPSLGEVGRVSWFVTGGDPHVGSTRGKSVVMPVEISNTSGKPVTVFGEKALLEIFGRKVPEAAALAEKQVREKAGKTAGEPLSKSDMNDVRRNTRAMAERAMWTEVGETVRASASGIGKVELTDSVFSKSGNGEFTLTSKPENVRLPKGAAAELVEAIKAGAPPAEPGVLEAARDLASREKWVGHVQGAFRVGGKVLLVVGVANDAYRIYTATDKVKTSVEVAGGWAGATAMGGAFAAWYTPADAAGPWAWVGHGVGTLVAGGVGYFVGSNVTKAAYELTVEGKPLEIGF